MYYFRAWDSSAHRNLLVDVFENAQVKAELQGVVIAELEFAFANNYDPRKHYANMFGVTGPQVCVMCDPDGNKVGNALYTNPVPTPDRFLEWLKATKALAVPPLKTAPSDAKEKLADRPPR